MQFTQSGHDQIPIALSQSGAIGNGFSTKDLKELSDYLKELTFDY